MTVSSDVSCSPMPSRRITSSGGGALSDRGQGERSRQPHLPVAVVECLGKRRLRFLVHRNLPGPRRPGSESAHRPGAGVHEAGRRLRPWPRARRTLLSRRRARVRGSRRRDRSARRRRGLVPCRAGPSARGLQQFDILLPLRGGGRRHAAWPRLDRRPARAGSPRRGRRPTRTRSRTSGGTSPAVPQAERQRVAVGRPLRIVMREAGAQRHMIADIDRHAAEELLVRMTTPSSRSGALAAPANRRSRSVGMTSPLTSQPELCAERSQTLIHCAVSQARPAIYCSTPGVTVWTSPVGYSAWRRSSAQDRRIRAAVKRGRQRRRRSATSADGRRLACRRPGHRHSPRVRSDNRRAPRHRYLCGRNGASFRRWRRWSCSRPDGAGPPKPLTASRGHFRRGCSCHPGRCATATDAAAFAA